MRSIRFPDLTTFLREALEQQNFSTPAGCDEANKVLLDALLEYRDALSLTDFSLMGSSEESTGVRFYSWQGSTEDQMSFWDDQYLQDNDGAQPWISSCSAPPGCIGGDCAFGCAWQEANRKDDAERERYGRFLDVRWSRVAATGKLPDEWITNENGNWTRVVINAHETIQDPPRIQPALHATVFRRTYQPISFSYAAGGDRSSDRFPTTYEAMRAVEAMYECTGDMSESFEREIVIRNDRKAAG